MTGFELGWGIVLLAYITPFALWAMVRFWRDHDDRFVTRAAGLWTAGLVLLFALHAAHVPPIWALAALGLLAAGAGTYRFLTR